MRARRYRKEAVTNVTTSNSDSKSLHEQIYRLLADHGLTYLEAKEILFEMHHDMAEIAIRKKMTYQKP